jgi:hypothetical protein
MVNWRFGHSKAYADISDFDPIVINDVKNRLRPSAQKPTSAPWVYNSQFCDKLAETVDLDKSTKEAWEKQIEDLRLDIVDKDIPEAGDNPYFGALFLTHFLASNDYPQGPYTINTDMIMGIISEKEEFMKTLQKMRFFAAVHAIIEYLYIPPYFVTGLGASTLISRNALIYYLCFNRKTFTYKETQNRGDYILIHPSSAMPWYNL